MPCSGPSNEEIRKANVHKELYLLILDTSSQFFPNGKGKITPGLLSDCLKYLDNINRGAYATDAFFHRATDALCQTIRGFSPDEDERYLRNAYNPVSVRLNFWWMQHEEWDNKRRNRDLEVARHNFAHERAQAAYSEVYEKALKESYDILNDGDKE